jgi:hypothetical protein
MQAPDVVCRVVIDQFRPDAKPHQHLFGKGFVCLPVPVKRDSPPVQLAEKLGSGKLPVLEYVERAVERLNVNQLLL